jgi:hypothetical protein
MERQNDLSATTQASQGFQRLRPSKRELQASTPFGAAWAKTTPGEKTFKHPKR